jgi:NAD(P)-dependent dehydrogenase (short-subunit alcohol dehydrogenase family)
MCNRPELKGRIALVTGGARGRPLAVGLATRGATVVVTMRDVLQADALARCIAAQTANPDVHALGLDLSSLASVRLAAHDFIARFGKLHVLVSDTSSDRLGPFLLANLLLDTMKQSGRGKVIRLGSLDSRQQVWSASG